MATWEPWIPSAPRRCWGFSCLCCCPLGRRERPQQCHGHLDLVCHAQLFTTCLLRSTQPFPLCWAAGLSLVTKAWSARLGSACEHSSWALPTDNSRQGAKTLPWTCWALHAGLSAHLSGEPKTWPPGKGHPAPGPAALTLCGLEQVTCLLLAWVFSSETGSGKRLDEAVRKECSGWTGWLQQKLGCEGSYTRTQMGQAGPGGWG